GHPQAGPRGGEHLGDPYHVDGAGTGPPRTHRREGRGTSLREHGVHLGGQGVAQGVPLRRRPVPLRGSLTAPPATPPSWRRTPHRSPAPPDEAPPSAGSARRCPRGRGAHAPWVSPAPAHSCAAPPARPPRTAVTRARARTPARTPPPPGPGRAAPAEPPR